MQAAEKQPLLVPAFVVGLALWLAPLPILVVPVLLLVPVLVPVVPVALVLVLILVMPVLLWLLPLPLTVVVVAGGLGALEGMILAALLGFGVWSTAARISRGASLDGGGGGQGAGPNGRVIRNKEVRLAKPLPPHIFPTNKKAQGIAVLPAPRAPLPPLSHAHMLTD